MEKAAVYLVRCTRLYDPGHSTGHIGTYPDTMASTINQRAMHEDVVPVVRAVSRLEGSFLIAAYCNSGEHRSVAIAEMVYRLFLQLGCYTVKRDLCDSLWSRRGCGCCTICSLSTSHDVRDRAVAKFVQMVIYS